MGGTAARPGCVELGDLLSWSGCVEPGDSPSWPGCLESDGSLHPELPPCCLLCCSSTVRLRIDFPVKRHSLLYLNIYTKTVDKYDLTALKRESYSTVDVKPKTFSSGLFLQGSSFPLALYTVKKG
jgi:hypothetical protein